MTNPLHPTCYGPTTVFAGWFRCVMSCPLAILMLWGHKRVSVAVVVEACNVFCRFYRFVLHLFPFVARQYRNNRRHALGTIARNAVSKNLQTKPTWKCVRACVPASHLDIIVYRLKWQTLASRLARLTRTDVRRTEPARQLSCRPAPVIRGSLIDSLTLQTTTGNGRGEGCRIKWTHFDREVSFPIASAVVVGLYGYRLLSDVPPWQIPWWCCDVQMFGYDTDRWR